MSDRQHCEFCGAIFATPDELRRHNLIAHMGRPFAPRCEVCDQSFESPADLKAHHETAHRAGSA